MYEPLHNKVETNSFNKCFSFTFLSDFIETWSNDERLSGPLRPTSEGNVFFNYIKNVIFLQLCVTIYCQVMLRVAGM